MHGFIGSGKTTRAKTLEREFSAIRLSPDEWMSVLFGSDPPASDFPRLLADLLTLFESIWIAAARSGTPVILDYGFWTRASRSRIEERLVELGLPHTWVVLDTPIEECRARNQARQGTAKSELNITDATFDHFIEGFEPMGDATHPAERGPEGGRCEPGRDRQGS